jgi:Clp amino terminal domain, pathogenicity island component
VVLESFNPAARTVVGIARDMARNDRSHLIETDHLLLALTVMRGTDASRALALLGVSEADVRKRMKRKGRWHQPSPPHIPFSPGLKQVIRAGAAWASRHGDLEISSAHLLLWLVAHPQSAAGRILTDLGVSQNSAWNALAEVVGPGQSAEELRDAGQVVTGRNAARRASGDPHRQGAGATEVSMRSVMRVDSPPDQAWTLLSSPHVWALSRGCVMFDVPGPDRRWLLAGEFPGSRGTGPRCLVFETSVAPARMELKLSGRLRGPLGFALSVVPRGPGASDLSVSCTVTGTGNAGPGLQAAMKRQLDEWLRAIATVLMSPGPHPAGEIPPELLRAWTAERRIEQPVTRTAAVLIDAGPDTVWNVLRSAWTPEIEGWAHGMCSGYVPGAPVGAVGEMRYGVYRGAEGSTGGFVDVVIQYEERRSVVTQGISPWGDRTSFTLSAEGGMSRLEMTQEWPGAKLAASTEEFATELLESPRRHLDAYKAHIESSTRGTAEPA